jgi:hypothetical protein
MYERILALLAQHGEQTAAQLTVALSRPDRSVRNAIINLSYQGKIERVYHWNGPARYSLPVERPFPRMGAGEYQPLRPSGTRPESIRGVQE